MQEQSICDTCASSKQPMYSMVKVHKEISDYGLISYQPSCLLSHCLFWRLGLSIVLGCRKSSI